MIRSWKHSNFRSFSQEGEDLVLTRFLDISKPGFYIDVGAHHPFRFSNTALLYENGWTGINIEPTPGAIHAFQKLRPRDINLACAISEQESKKTFFEFDESALNTFDFGRAQVIQREKLYKLKSEVIVDTIPLSKIIQKYAAKKTVDLLTIDVENYEMNVLKSIDWKVSQPRVIMIETLGYDLTNIGDSTVHQFLEELGYKIKARTFNTSFYFL